VVAGNGRQRVECQGVSAVASMAWARFAGSRLLRACLVKGRELDIAGSLSLQSPQLIDHCVIQVQANHLEISLDGASSFTLNLVNPLSKIVLGGSDFRLRAGQRSVSFINDAGHWQMVETNH
jgi:hypothetical protein